MSWNDQSLHLAVSTQSRTFDISLNPESHASKASVVINGRGYSISGDKEAISWIQERIHEKKDFTNLGEFNAVLHDKSEAINKIQRTANETLIPSRQSKITQNISPKIAPPDEIKASSIQERMQAYAIPGARVAVIEDFELDWVQGFGNLDDPQTRIQAASVSKTIAAMSILALVGEEGLDTDVGLKLSESNPALWKKINPNGYPITIRDLLSHRAGVILGHVDVSGFRGYEAGEKHDKIPTIDEILEGHDEEKRPHVNSGPIRVVEKPGNEHYQGGGPTILQKWVEVTHKEEKKDFATVVKEKVFNPLGMDHSGYSAAGIPTTKGHGDDGKTIEGNARIYPELAAAGAWTTPEDLVKLVIEIQNAYRGKGKVLNQETAKKMLEPQHGLGVAVPDVKGTRYFFHTGENKGFRCIIIGNTDGQGAVIMTNSDNGAALYQEILSKIAEEYQWKDSEQVEKLAPLMNLEEAKHVDKEAWAAKAVGSYYDTREPEVSVNVSRGPKGKIIGQFIVADTKENPFELIPVSATRACFKRGDNAPYEYVDLEGDRLVFSFGGKFIQN